jgi:signal transduction histidine kinase
VFSNPLGNALDHGRAEGAVTVEVWSRDDGFHVADDGPDVPPGEREAIFEHGYTAVEEGTGFGMAIVRTIVEAHGWEVDAGESDAGGLRVDVAGVADPRR